VRKSLPVAIVCLLIWSCSAHPALAADFYYIGSSDSEHITILDPSSISGTQGGHKTFHLAEITDFTLWIDRSIEVDCGSKQVRMVSIISHLAGGDTIDLSSYNKDVNVWHALEPGLQIAGSDLTQTRDLVCKYPDQKPTGDQVFTFPDFQSALEVLSQVITNNKKGK